MTARHLRPTPRRRQIARSIAIPTLVAAALGVAAPAMAAKPAGGPSSGGSSLTLVLKNSTDGVAHYGQDVTFNASSTATTEPHVRLACSQAGTVVYSTQTGYYASYPWPWTQTMTLASGAWTSGAADCTAVLYWFNGSKTVTGATLNFPVYA